MILALRTDKPEAELYLLDNSGDITAEYKWLADRQLAATLHKTLDDFMAKNKAGFDELAGIIVFRGPGSFTGLRIGVTVANAISYAQQIPVGGASGESWLKRGVMQLSKIKAGQYVSPSYGDTPHITRPVK
jgi:tRNA threonylcarbamoyladenosine biosynthesis protein TsaB